MDKSWVWLPRASVEYEEGARAFVFASAKTLGNPLQMFCPCMDCRNVNHQDINTVLDHLVIRGMDQKYKRSACWSIHGDISSEKTVDEQRGDLEAYELFRSAFFDNEDNTQFSNKNGEPPEVFEEESEFKKKLEDELETVEEFVTAPLPIEDNDDLGNESSDDESLCVRADCEGVLIIG